MFRAFPDGKDIRIARGEPVIDHDAAIDRDPRVMGELCIRPNANRADHEIGGKDPPAGKLECCSAIFAQNPFCVGAEQHFNIFSLDCSL